MTRTSTLHATPVLDDEFAFTRLTTDGPASAASLSELLATPDVSAETWLFACPHDDDIVIGAGLWLMAAAQAGADVQVLITTDGRMGYCTPAQRERIVDIRRDECLRSFEMLGVDASKVHMLGFPDCALSEFLGRRPASSGEPQIQGFTGLQNAFVAKLRELRPNRLLMPSPADYHPDHQVVYNEMQISLFHAAGLIWPELGEPADVPEVYQLAVYCDFPATPNLQIRAAEACFARKIAAIEAYASQLQIDMLVKKIRNAGAFEYMREVNFRFYNPEHYQPLFAK